MNGAGATPLKLALILKKIMCSLKHDAPKFLSQGTKGAYIYQPLSKP